MTKTTQKHMLTEINIIFRAVCEIYIMWLIAMLIDKKVTFAFNSRNSDES